MLASTHTMNRKKPIGSTLHRVVDFCSPHALKLIVFAVLLGSVSSVIESSFLFVIQGFLRAIGLLDPQKAILPDFYPVELRTNLAIIVLFGFLRSGFDYVKMRNADETRQSFLAHQRRFCTQLAFHSFGKYNHHELVSVFTGLINRGSTMFQLIPELCVSLLMTLGLGLIMLRTSWKETFVSLGLLAIAAIPMQLLRKKDDLGRPIDSELSIATKTLMESLRNLYLLRFLGKEKSEKERLLISIDAYRRHYRHYSRAVGFTLNAPQAIGVLVLVATATTSLTYFSTDPLVLMGFFYLFMRFSRSLSSSYSYGMELWINRSSWKEMFQFYCEAAESLSQEDNSLKNDRQLSFTDWEWNNSGIQIQNLEFGYARSPLPLFKNLNLQILPGQKVLFHGPSGTGKSTLLQLIAGFVEPTSGQISVGGHALREVKTHLLSQAAFVGPDPFLISGTILENLLYGHPEPGKVTSAEIDEALHLSACEFVREIPLGVNSSLRSQVAFSTGQQQRLSIARALLRRPKLLLFDEFTSNLDAQTEMLILQRLTPFLSDKMVLLVSHKQLEGWRFSAQITFPIM